MRKVRIYPRERTRLLLLAAATLTAGLFNGFFGTGGGMVLVLSLSALLGHGRTKEAFVLSSFGVLLFSLVSLSLYPTGGNEGAFLTFAPPALLGGLLGALLFGRIGTRLLRKIFAALLLYSGLKLMEVL